VAHNASFDRKVLACELARVGLPLPGLPVYCTMKLARRVLKGYRSYSLGVLASHLAIDTGRAHRALADAHTALGVLHACLAAQPGRGLASLHGPATVL
jgi:DNA polymerase III subunit epsilon